MNQLCCCLQANAAKTHTHLLASYGCKNLPFSDTNPSTHTHKPPAHTHTHKPIILTTDTDTKTPKIYAKKYQVTDAPIKPELSTSSVLKVSRSSNSTALAMQLSINSSGSGEEGGHASPGSMLDAGVGAHFDNPLRQYLYWLSRQVPAIWTCQLATRTQYGQEPKKKWGSTTKIQALKIEYNIEYAINIE